MSVLQVEKLTFAYGENQVLRGIDFQVGPGEIFCIFGTNGCGKTTLLDCILGLNTPDCGRIAINRNPAKALSPAMTARQVAYVSQKSDRTFPYTVLEIVLMGRTAYTGLFSSPGKADVEMAEAALESVGMQDFSRRIFTRLSGGETQLVKIARALAQETPLILFDEPTTHLDFRHELNIIQHIMKVVREKGVSVVMATHAPNHAFFFESHGMPTRVALMQDGRFGAIGTPSEVLTPTNMAKVFKVVTKRFNNEEGDMLHQFLMPVDFCEPHEDPNPPQP